MQINSVAVRERLINGRRRRGLSQRRAANAAGIDHSYLSRIENGIQQIDRISLHVIFRLAEVYRISVKRLLGIK